MRRLWSLALLVAGIAAYRTAHLPIVPHDGSICGMTRPPTSLADSGLHLPALLVAVGAMLDLLASFALRRSPVPRAIAGRRDLPWIPFASPARVMLDLAAAPGRHDRRRQLRCRRGTPRAAAPTA